MKKKQHVKIPAAFDAAELQRRYEVAVDRYMNGYIDDSRNFVFACSERYEFPTPVDAYQFCIEMGAKGRKVYDKRPVHQFPGCIPVHLMKTEEDQAADIAKIKTEVEAAYLAELEAVRQGQIALLIEQQESLFQRKEAERIEVQRQARLEQFRRDAEAVL